jgi:elongation factor G
MTEYTTTEIRNVAFVGHAGAGKTLLTEALAHNAGAITAKGSIEKGTTVTDFDDLEKKHQHSLTSSLAAFDHNGWQVNLIDTPGYPDFIGSAFSVLPAVETVAIVINAQRGIESTARRMLEWARDQNQCRMVIINRIDAEEVDLEAVYNRSRLCLAENAWQLTYRLPAALLLQIVFSARQESPIFLQLKKHTRRSWIKLLKSMKS